VNVVFPIFVLLVGIGALVTWRRTRKPHERTREGPVPGYSYTDGEELDLEAELPLVRGEDWVPLSIETFHSSERPRIVLGIDLQREVDSDTLRDFLHDCARDVIRRTRARVFFAEAYVGEQPRGYYMWSPDGGGWTGRDGRHEVFVEVQ
jgi:hypothetical protein